jgi:hypothetical protein
MVRHNLFNIKNDMGVYTINQQKVNPTKVFEANLRLKKLAKS